jgi:hypothetical protein
VELVFIRGDANRRLSPLIQEFDIEEALDECLGCIHRSGGAPEYCIQECQFFDSRTEPLLVIVKALLSLPKLQLSADRKRQMLNRIVNSMYRQAN